jgi:isopenicillin N synthase-like dioxygenase
VSQLTDSAAVEALRASIPDLKESLEISSNETTSGQYPNRWPPETASNGLLGFRQTMTDFSAQLQALHVALMRAVAVAMGLPGEGGEGGEGGGERYFDRFVCDADNTLRLLHYPSVRRDLFRINPGQVRAGEHSDYGSVTFLFQDERGGLQVKSPSGEFVDAAPIAGTCVVNTGDLLARWSNDTIKSTVHRVVEPPRREGEEDGEVYPARYSIA